MYTRGKQPEQLSYRPEELRSFGYAASSFAKILSNNQLSAFITIQLRSFALLRFWLFDLVRPMKTNRFAQLLPVETVIGQSWASRAARSSLDSSQAQSLAAGLASYALQAKLRNNYKRCVA